MGTTAPCLRPEERKHGMTWAGNGSYTNRMEQPISSVFQTFRFTIVTHRSQIDLSCGSGPFEKICTFKCSSPGKPKPTLRSHFTTSGGVGSDFSGRRELPVPKPKHPKQHGKANDQQEQGLLGESQRKMKMPKLLKSKYFSRMLCMYIYIYT